MRHRTVQGGPGGDPCADGVGDAVAERRRVLRQHAGRVHPCAERVADRLVLPVARATVVMPLRDVLHRLAVGGDVPLEPPRVARQLVHHAAVDAPRCPVDTIVRAHQPRHVRVPHARVEDRQVRVRLVLLRDDGVEPVSVDAAPAVHVVRVQVLAARRHLQTTRILTLLHAPHKLHRVHGHSVGILPGHFLAPPPARIPHKVDVRRPVRETRVPHVVEGTCLVRDRPPDQAPQRAVERAPRRHNLRKRRRVRRDAAEADAARLGDAVQGLRPPLVRGQVQAWDAGCGVPRQVRLLLQVELRGDPRGPLARRPCLVAQRRAGERGALAGAQLLCGAGEHQRRCAARLRVHEHHVQHRNRDDHRDGQPEPRATRPRPVPLGRGHPAQRVPPARVRRRGGGGCACGGREESVVAYAAVRRRCEACAKLNFLPFIVRLPCRGRGRNHHDNEVQIL
eukprot:Rhum_TRINITY_DN15441_c6_g1::Rhum_TRINITY_DN15441_c6_g1_i1::g.154967::m.154967